VGVYGLFCLFNATISWFTPVLVGKSLLIYTCLVKFRLYFYGLPVVGLPI
jgi:hypothetical protein